MSASGYIAVELSPRWTHAVWGLLLATAAVAGAVLGGELTTTVAGAAMGAFMVLPAGALAALTLWSLGSVSLRALAPDLPSWRRRTQVLRVVFGVLAGGLIGLEITIAFAVLGGATREATVWVAVPTVTVVVAGVLYPPKPHGDPLQAMQSPQPK